MAVRSKQLVARRSGGAGVVSYYTAAAGETVLVKDLNIFARLGTPGSLSLELTTPSGPFLPLLFLELAFRERRHLEVWWVLQPGDELVGVTSVSDGYTLLFSGAELEGVAD